MIATTSFMGGEPSSCFGQFHRPARFANANLASFCANGTKKLQA
jgi:hypothetical protein